MEISREEKNKWHDLHNAIHSVEFVLDKLQKNYNFNSSDGHNLVAEAVVSFQLLRAQVESQDPMQKK